ncbi:glucose-6-phosphate dehydrogenase [Gordonia hankookensis]|uniref:Glucose-6-phosphate dehydrogenase n=1 Tax=Gordonia hankookensis TaxID=589403 RepID=A0ABR7WIW3_9ACTN|nr:glucose-6-phosphate dehydrogenase [Gordonia hankookensis]MBD1322516.1 glucose-6-phosphate dehydrogenase [Gordonia hankookensis]
MAETTLFILGATGDLTSRLLLPALEQLLALEPERDVRLVGVGRREVSDDQWRDRVREAFGDGQAPAAARLADSTTYLQADIGSADGLRTILGSAQGRPILYFAVPPAIAQASCEAMTDVEVPSGTILALEKPFGTDEASAHAFNQTLARLVPENQVFRVDHFLGQSILLDLIGVRFANRVFEPVWSADHIESVLIRYDETLGLEGRAGYYDKAGAFTDMLQSHLLELLSVVAMDSPASLAERDLRDATAAALRATRVWEGDPIRASHRARYTAGEVNGHRLPSYTDEEGVDPARNTETLAEATFEVCTARWAGVPFTLRSGKAIEPAVKEIALTFRPVRHLPEQFRGEAASNVLRFSFGPDTMSLRLNVHDGSHPFDLKATELDADLGVGSPRAYAEVLSGILDGDATLAVRGDTAEQCWRIVAPILDAWRSDQVPIDEYPAGSSGPTDWPAL